MILLVYGGSTKNILLKYKIRIAHAHNGAEHNMLACNAPFDYAIRSLDNVKHGLYSSK